MSWQLKVVQHGTGRVVAVPRFGSTSWQRRLDDVSQASTSWQPSETPRVKKWEWELEVWGWGKLVWAGPIVSSSYETGAPVSISARDLGQRFERLFIAVDRTYVQEDLGYIFGQITNDALRQAPTLDIDVITYPTGTFGDREYRAGAYERLADRQKELARTDIDYTFVGRKMLVGGAQIPGRPSWKLHDAMVERVSSTDDGMVQVNDAVVVGGRAADASAEADETPIGRWRDEASISVVGPLQLAYSESDILDEASAGKAARNRIGYYNGLLPSLNVALKEGQYDPDDLVCGAVVDTYLSDELIPYGQEGEYLLVTVDGTISDQGVGQVTLGLAQNNSEQS